MAQDRDGSWLKIAIPKSGVYELTAKEITSKGFKIKDIDPSKVQFYGSKAFVLPQQSNSIYRFEPIEIPSTFSGNTNKLGKKDQFLFYASASFENENSLSPHHYDKNNYVFVNLNGTRRKEIDNLSTDKSPITITALNYTERYETERYNVVNSGREWFGDFISSEYYQSLDFEGKVENSPIEAKFRMISATSTANYMKVFAQNELLGSIPLAISFYDKNDAFNRYNRVGNAVEKSFEIFSETEKLSLRFELEQSPKSSDGAYLDWYEITFLRNIRGSNQQFEGSFNSEIGEEYKLESKDNDIAWDVSDPLNAFVINSSFRAINSKTKIVIFDKDKLLKSPKIVRFEPNDLAISNVPELIIVSPFSFLKAAEKLAQYRRSTDLLDTEVIILEDIYNKYSGGKVDPSAIRNFIKEVWSKDPNTLKYLLLFGDANFDFKNNRNLDYVDIANYIPAYQSRESLEPIYSFSSDDYYGFLAHGLGEWPEGTSINNSYFSSSDTTHKLDIGVGRLPVRNLIEAYDAVEKIINYETNKANLGLWRNKVTFVADDGDFNKHLRDAEQFSDQLSVANSDLEIEKLYLDSFEQVQTDLGVRSQTASIALDQAIEQGSFLINFNGHGSENGWTDEKLLTLDQIFRWKNKNQLPIFFTATCEYGRYDNPSKVSGAELSLLDKTNGAIALLTTTRPVFSSTNFKINKAFYEELENSENTRLGDIFKKTKNKSIAGVINRNFALLGDPALRIPRPQKKIIITEVNGETNDIVLQNQSKAIFKGKILDESFNGRIFGKFYDQATKAETLGNASSKTKYETYDNLIFEGISEIVNGTFQFEFIVPKNTNEGEKNGIAYFYALDSDSTQEFIGRFNDYKITKSLSDSINNDKEGPFVTLMESEDKDLLHFDLSDVSGINLSTINQEYGILLTIDDTINLELKKYYLATDGFKKGQISFPLPKLSKGQHTIELKVRDIYNNETRESFLLVIAEEKLQITEGLSFPNPTNDIVTFRFTQSNKGEDLNIKVNLFDLKGIQIASESTQCYICDPIVEIGMNLEPMNLLNGTYLYQIIALDLNSGEKTQTGGKIIFWK